MPQVGVWCSMSWNPVLCNSYKPISQLRVWSGQSSCPLWHALWHISYVIQNRCSYHGFCSDWTAKVCIVFIWWGLFMPSQQSGCQESEVKLVWFCFCCFFTFSSWLSLSNFLHNKFKFLQGWLKDIRNYLAAYITPLVQSANDEHASFSSSLFFFFKAEHILQLFTSLAWLYMIQLTKNIWLEIDKFEGGTQTIKVPNRNICCPSSEEECTETIASV